MKILNKQWFPENKGKASSIIFIGYAVGGVIFGEVATNYINPSDLSPDKSYYDDAKDEK